MVRGSFRHRGGHRSHRRVDSARRTCRLGRRANPPGAPRRADHLVRAAYCCVERDREVVCGCFAHGRDRRQLRISNRTPSKTTATVPAAYASGLSHRSRPPSCLSADSTVAGSVLRTAAAAFTSARQRDSAGICRPRFVVAAEVTGPVSDGAHRPRRSCLLVAVRPTRSAAGSRAAQRWRG